MLAELKKQVEAALSPIHEHLEQFWTNIALEDGWVSRILVVRPKPITVESIRMPSALMRKRAGKRPVIIMFHGGGYSSSSPLQLTPIARLFVEHADATVLCPSYRLMPEHTWPKPVQDGMELVQRIVSDQSYHYGASPLDGMIIGGTSIGGFMAAIIAGLTTADPVGYPLSHPLTGLFLSAPLLFTENLVPLEYKNLWKSRQESHRVPDPNTAAVEAVISGWICRDLQSLWFNPVNLFTGPGKTLSDPSKTSPIYRQAIGESPMSKESLVGRYPPVYLQAMSQDPLRDDAIVYEKILAQAGVQTKIHHFPDDLHTAVTISSSVTSPKSQCPTVEEGTIEGLFWLVKSERTI